MADDFEGVSTFLAVAEARSFRGAGERLGVSASAVSQGIRRLEERLGVSLLHRTTRSVSLTAAGERFYAAARPALDGVQAGAAAVGEMADRPRGTVRLHVAPSADSFLSRETLGEFLKQYPEIGLDLIADYSSPDIVAEGYDAGVRLGEVIDQDMISVPVSGPMRLLVVGAPAYLALHPPPVHPRDLTGHACINWRAPAHPPYRWEFEDEGREFSVSVPARVVTNDTDLMLRLAVEGLALALVRENRVRPFIERGELVAVLEEFSIPFPGFYLYYPQRRQASPALRALIDFVLELRQREGRLA